MCGGVVAAGLSDEGEVGGEDDVGAAVQGELWDDMRGGVLCDLGFRFFRLKIIGGIL